MFWLTWYSLFSYLLLLVSPMDIEDLQDLFGNDNCIEASLVSIPLKQSDPVILDSNSGSQETLFLNNSINEKSALLEIHELAQFNNLELVFKLLSEDGPPHAKTFTVKLILGDESYEGTGSSLKTAKHSAALLALENTLFEHPPEKNKVDEKQSQTPTVVLNNLAMRLGIAVSYVLLNGHEEEAIDSYGAYDEAYGGSKSWFPKLNSTFDPLRVPVEDAQISGPFTVKVKVGDFAVKGVGHSIQAARHDAAVNAIKIMEKEALFRDNVCSRDESTDECIKKKDSLKSPITRVHEAGQLYNLPVSFDVIGEKGKSHQKVFTTQCVLGDFVTEAEGNSKKESKRLAAEKMLKYLPTLSAKYGGINENAIVNGLSNKKKKRKKKKKVVRDADTTIADSVASVMSSIWTDDTNSDSSQNQKKADNRHHTKRSPKDKILEVGGKLNIPIDFTDLGKNNNEFVSLMSLGVRPPQMCLGKGATREKSHDAGALHGLKFLEKSGIYDKAYFTETGHSDEIYEYVLEDDNKGYGHFDEATEE